MKLLNAAINVSLGVILALLILFVLHHIIGTLPVIFAFGLGVMCTALMNLLNPINK